MKREFASSVIFLGLVMLTAISLIGCSTIPLPGTEGDTARVSANYGYTPLDPLPIPPIDPTKIKDVLSFLPDTTMRLAIGQFDASGNISYGPVKIGSAGNNYEVILDYIQYTTKSFPVKIKSTTQPSSDRTKQYAQRLATVDASKADVLALLERQMST